MKNLTFLLFLLLTTLPLAAQVEVNNGGWMDRWTGERVKGNGDLITQERDIDGFTGIKSCCSFKVELAQSDDFSVRVEAESNLQEFIVTEVRGKTLHIKYSDDANFKSTEDIRVYVSLPLLEGIDASSSSRVRGTTPFRGDELDLDVSSSADISVDFSGSRVNLDASSSGSIEVRGTASRVTADASSASSIDASDLEAEDGVADVSSAASIKLRTTKTLRADASSAGSVHYSGNPQDVITDTSSAGRVRSSN
ncbi:hypothetical protein GGR28_003263 [Lewinella aquimaris]|uniref:Putative auto-transporter adhesin head GIN domain-containing protein n=1 Tax=Neolewinella aquimaris TaxID=1835722 RepID=A0A840EFB9_9BACT|nr:head GIN domain-containing protein [Neolewinella aquimaris]MBB4080628.1 hypothetical protein [Neolewinella aquimaris]